MFDYQFESSVPIDSSYQSPDKFCSTLPCRISKYEEIIAKESSDAEQEWAEAVGVKPQDLPKLLSPKGHFLALFAPECRLESIPKLTRAFQFLIYWDGKVELTPEAFGLTTFERDRHPSLLSPT